MKKHSVQCPHCTKCFEYVPPKKVKEVKGVEENKVYLESMKFWLGEFHKGWSFGGMQGKSLKDILRKLNNSILEGGKYVVTQELNILAFKHFCYSLPEFFKDKDLNVLNSKYNEIIEHLKKNKANGQTEWHSKNSRDRYSEAASRFKT